MSETAFGYPVVPLRARKGLVRILPRGWGDGRGFNLVNCKLITSCLSKDARSAFRSRSSHELWSLMRISRKSTADLQVSNSVRNIRESWMLSATTMYCCNCQRGQVVGFCILTLRCGNASAWMLPFCELAISGHASPNRLRYFEDRILGTRNKCETPTWPKVPICNTRR